MIPPTSTLDYLFLIIEPFWQIAGAIILSVLPAWGLASRLRVDPLTKLLVAAMGSYSLMYLLEFGAYLLSAPQWLPLSLLFAISITSAMYANSQWRKSPDTGPFPWDGLITWGGLAVWIIGMQSSIVVYGGASWFGDWHEHYERAIFFLDQLPSNTKFLEDLENWWVLAARGPAFNASAALLMGVFGRDFWVYQTLATVLNTFPVVAMALLIRDMARMRQLSALLWSFVLFGIAPFAVQQEIFTWTKFFALGFILGGIHLYRYASIQNRPWLVGLSFGAFTAGILAHYLVLIFALFFSFHLVYSAFKKHWGWRVVIYPAMACSLFLATWFVYLIATFGLQATLTANSTFGDEYARQSTPAGIEPPARSKVFVGNIITTILPYSWRHGLKGMGHAPRVLQFDPRAGRQFTPSPKELNRKTEWFADLTNNPNSLLGALGWAGGAGVLIVIVLSIRQRRKERRDVPGEGHPADDIPKSEPGWIFWLIFFVLGIPLNILTHSTISPHGIAHINLLPFICLTAILLLRWLRDLPLYCKGLLTGVFLIESGLTTAALVALQERPVPLVLKVGGKVVADAKVGLNYIYVNNYALKLHENAVFLSDRLGDLTEPMSLIATVIAIGLLVLPLIWSSLGRTREEQMQKGKFREGPE